MSSVGEVLGWKFNYAPGIRTLDGVITAWPAGLGPQPNDAQIAAYTTEYEAAKPDLAAAIDIDRPDKFTRLLFEINFDQENRIRVLEGKPAISRAQYRAALIAFYKALP